MNEQTPVLSLEEKIAKSSQVAAISYDGERQELTVEFKKGAGGAPADVRYVYSGVPVEIYRELLGADSLGSYLYRNVTGGKGRSAPFGFAKIDKATGEVLALVKADGVA